MIKNGDIRLAPHVVELIERTRREKDPNEAIKIIATLTAKPMHEVFEDGAWRPGVKNWNGKIELGDPHSPLKILDQKRFRSILREGRPLLIRENDRYIIVEHVKADVRQEKPPYLWFRTTTYL